MSDNLNINYFILNYLIIIVNCAFPFQIWKILYPPIFQGFPKKFQQKIMAESNSAIHNFILFFIRTKSNFSFHRADPASFCSSAAALSLLLHLRRLHRHCSRHPLDHHEHHRTDKSTSDRRCRHPHGIRSDPVKSSQLCHEHRSCIHHDMQ